MIGVMIGVMKLNLVVEYEREVFCELIYWQNFSQQQQISNLLLKSVILNEI